MIKKTFLLVLLTLPFALLAQQTQKASIVWGEDMNDRKDGFLVYTIDEYEGSVIQMMSTKKERFLQRMGADMGVLAKGELDLELGKDDLILEDEVLFDGKLLLFASNFDKKADETRLYMRSYDVKNLNTLTDWSEIASLSASKRRNQGEFEIAVSPKEEKLLVYYYLPYLKGGPEKIGFNILDKELNKVWTDNVTLEYADEDFVVRSVDVDDDGSVLLLGRFNELGRREVREKIKAEKTYYEYHLLVFNGAGQTPKNFELRLGDKFLQELHVTIPPDGNEIICTGFYSEEGTSSVVGSYYMKLDRSTKEVLKSTYHRFEEDFITMYMTEKQEAKAKKKASRRNDELELNDFQVTDVVVYPDGSLTVASEQYDFWVTTSYRTDANGRTTQVNTYHYLYRDIIVIHLDQEGEVIWKARVPKNQYTRNDDGYASSNSLAAVNGELYLVFNDSERNLGFKKGDVLYRMRLKKKDAIITLVHIDANGHFTREALVEVERKDMLCIPKKSTEVSDKILLVAEERKNNKFGVVTFK